MTRKEIQTFIKSGFVQLSESFDFGTGRITEFNAARANSYPSAWLESLIVDTEYIEPVTLPYDTWPIKIHIARKDKIDSSTEEYEEIINECDLTAQKVMRFYNAAKLTVTTGVNRSPFIKKHADCLTGVVLSFNLKLPDTTDVC